MTFAAHRSIVRSLVLGQGSLLNLMLGADGFVYVSNTNAIFKVVPQ